MLGYPTRNPAIVEVLLNAPTVRPTIERAHEGPIPGHWITDEPLAHCFVGEGGIFIFANLGDDEYLAHVGILAGYRGSYGVKLGREAFAYLFGALKARRCLAQAPLHLPQVGVFAKRLGFKHARLDPVGGYEHLIKEAE